MKENAPPEHASPISYSMRLPALSRSSRASSNSVKSESLKKGRHTIIFWDF
jgi:hypothetical protein